MKLRLSPLSTIVGIILSSLLFLGVSNFAFSAATPSVISYQGFLTSATGTAQTGTTTVTIRIYDAATGGTLLFEELHPLVGINNGYFSVAIGSVGDVSGGTSASSITDLTFDRSYYVTVELDTPFSTGEMTLAGGTRAQLGTVPFANVAYGALQATSSTGLLTQKGRMYFNTGDNQLYVYDGSAWNAVGIAGASNFTTLTIASTTANGTTPLFNVSTTSSLFSVLANGNVGIGKTSPQSPLDVKSKGNTTLSGVRLENQADTNITATIYEILPGVGAFELRTNSGFGVTGLQSVRVTAQGSSYFNGGNIGIGTTTPTALLSVASSTATGTTRLVGVGTSSEIFTILANGNVGIGVADPQALLDLNRGNANQDKIVWVDTASYRAKLTKSAGNLGVIAVEGSNSLFGFQTRNTYNSGSWDNTLAITTTGNVGIGTTTPSSKLFVTGSSTSSLFTVASSTGSVFLTVLANGNVGMGVTSPSTGLHIGGVSNTDLVTIGSTGTIQPTLQRNSDGGLTVSNNGNVGSTGAVFSIKDNVGSQEFFRVNGDGNLGIGTTSPQKKLHIYGDNGTDFLFQVESPNREANFLLLSASSSPQTASFSFRQGSAAGDGWNIANNASSSLVFTSRVSGVNTDRFTVLASGNLGIGTTTPSQKLDVNGSVVTNGSYYLSSGANPLARIWYDGVLKLDNGSNVVRTMGPAQIDGNLYLNNGNLYGSASALSIFGTNSTTHGNTQFYSNNSVERMRITSAGNVGVGTTTPTSLFSVASSTANGTSSLFSIGTSSVIFTILANGNMGIGTTTPVAALSLASSTSSTGGIYFGSDTNLYRTSSNYLKTDGYFYASQIITSTANNYGVGTRGVYAPVGYPLVLWTDNGNMPIAISPNGSGSTTINGTGSTGNIILATGGGNVGIGTTTPIGKLSVADTSVRVRADASGSTGQSEFFAMNDVSRYTGIATYGSTKTGTVMGITRANLSEIVSFADNMVVYNSTNAPLIFGTNNTERIRISSGGNLGIGTTTPGSLLSVQGNAYIGGDIYATGTLGVAGQSSFTTASATAITANTLYSTDTSLTNATSSNFFATLLNAVTAVITNLTATTGTITNLTSTDATSTNLVTTGTTTLATLGGAVVIGNSTPNSSYILDIRSSGNVQQRIQSSDNQAALHLSGTFGQVLNSTGDFYLTNNDVTGAMIFRTNASTERIRITSAGNVGIGTTTPVASLSLGSGQVVVPDGLATAPSYSFGTELGSGIFRPSVGVIGFGINNAERMRVNASNQVIVGRSGFIGFSSTAATTLGAADIAVARNAANVLEVNTGVNGTLATLVAGVIGIGTSSPTYPLQVSGTIFVDKSVYSDPSAENGYRIKFQDYGGINNDAGIGIATTTGSMWFNNVAGAGYYFNFGTNGQKITFDSYGSIGIGTTTPTAALSVSSDASLSGQRGTLQLASITNPNKYLYAGYSNLHDAAYIQSVDYTVNWKNLLLNPVGGNVGIGTTTPSNLLHVRGDSATTLEVARFENTNTGGYTSVAINRSANNRYAMLSYGTLATADWLTGTGYAGGATNSSYQIGTGYNTSDAKVTVTTAGNVGIGTTTPASKLVIYNDANNYADIMTSSGHSSFVRSITAGAVLSVAQRNTSGYGMFIQTAGTSTTDYALRVASNGGTTNGLVVANSGNVGIGTSTPTTQLYIYDASGAATITMDNAGSVMQFLNQGGGLMRIQSGINGGLSFGSGADTNIYRNSTSVLRTNSSFLVDGNVGIGTTTPLSTLSIASSTAAGTSRLLSVGTSSEIFTILANGNVGIGTTSPIAKLDVWGNFNVGTSSLASFIVNSATRVVSIPGTVLGRSFDINYDAAGVTMSVFSADDLTLKLSDDSALFDIDGDAATHNARIITGTGGSVNLNNSLYAFKNGDIGIGTSTPTSLFSLASSTATGTSRLMSIGTSSEILTVLANGNIGIGTMSPGTPLDVNGTTTIRGRLSVNGANFTDNDGPIAMGVKMTSGTESGLFVSDNFAGNSRSALISANLTDPSAFAGTNAASFVMGTQTNNINTGTGLGAAVNIVGVNGSTANTNVNVWSQIQTTNVQNTGTTYNFIARNYVQGNGIATTTLSNYVGYESFGQMAAATTSVTNVYDFRASDYANLSNGFITNRYGLYLGFTNTNVTNAYGIYQANTGINNYFAGNVGIGTTTPTSLLSIASSTATGTSRLFSVGASSEILTVLANGNVGIGTTTPGYNAVISGSDAALSIDNNSGSASFIRMNNYGTQRFVLDARSAATSFNSLTAPLAFITSSIERVRIDNSGFVGIGTTTPSQLLHLNGTNGTMRISDVNNNANAWLDMGMTSGGGVAQIKSTQSPLILGTTNSTFYLRLDTAGAERMRIDGSGNIGIGTTTPNALFSVSSSTATGTSRLMSIGTSSEIFTVLANGNVGIGTSTPGYAFTSIGSSFFGSSAGVRITANGSVGDITGMNQSGANNDLGFRTGGAYNLYINTLGNVGIGTTTPAVKLDLVGNMQLTTSAAADGIKLLRSDGERVAWLADADGAGQGGLYLFNGSNSNTLFFGANASSFINGGHLGLGTSTPGSRLDVASSTSTSDVDIFRIITDVGSTGNVKFRIDSDGDVFTDGGTTIGTPADLAENYPTNDPTIVPGMVVTLSTTTMTWSQSLPNGSTTDYEITTVKKAEKGEEVLGVISTRPGILLGGNTTNGIPVAFSGRVPVYVTGDVQAGDSLTISTSTPGYAMKQTTNSQSIGRAISSSSPNATSSLVMMVVENTNRTITLSGQSGLAFLSSATSTLPTTTVREELTTLLTNGYSVVKEYVAVTVKGVVGYFDTLHTNKLCVGAVCITEEEFERMVREKAAITDTSSQIILPSQEEAVLGSTSTPVAEISTTTEVVDGVVVTPPITQDSTESTSSEPVINVSP